MKRMSFNAIILILLMTWACGPKTDVEPVAEIKITFSQESVAFASETSSTTIDVTADHDWGVSSSESWCTVSPSGGVAGTTKLKITVSENKALVPRSAQLTFKSGRTNKIIEVVQHYRVEEVAIADATFKTYLLTNFDADYDGCISTVEADAITTLAPTDLGIKSITELGSFPALRSLDCSGNDLTALDLSASTRLETLDCSDNQLTELNISVNQSLTVLDCRNNPITSIYVWTGFVAPEGYLIPDDAIYVAPEIDTPAGYRLVWHDEFNSSKNAMPDTKKWWYETGDGGWGNNEIQNYVSGRSGTDTLAMVSNGTLKIIAKKIGSQTCSIRINTNDSWTYGYFEARLMLPKGKGTWPAFWMMPKNFSSWPRDGEIDIMEEVGYNPNHVSSSIHCQSYNHPNNTQKTAETYVATAQTEFHVYALEWTPDAIITYVDGKQLFRFNNDGNDNYETWPFDNPFYLKLNLAWGGNWGGAQGIDESCLPATYQIDYVRVFKKIE